MAEPHIPTSLTNMAVTIHTAPLPGEAKVLVFVEANAHVTHVMSLSAQAARELVVGLLDAIDIAAPADGDEPWWERG
jgi:hypothetical protein